MSNFVVQSNVHLNAIKGKINTLAADIATSQITGTHKTFTNGSDPTETITTPLKKEFIIQGGVDASSNSLTQLNPIKVDAAGLQYVSNANITKGQDVKAEGEPLQQVLIYGRKADGTLQPLECNGDRLLVDVIELSATGPSTPTALPSVACHGQVEGTSGFKNLQVNTNGVLKISNQRNEFLEIQGTSHAIGANSASSIEINANGYGKVRITVHSSSTDELLIEGSNTSGGTFMAFTSIFPGAQIIDSSSTTINLATILLESPPSFLRLRNKTADSITLNSYHFKSIVN